MTRVLTQHAEVRHSEYRGVPFDIANYLRLLPDLLKSTSLPSVIERSIQFYRGFNPIVPNNGSLGSQFYSCVSSEREPSQGPAVTLLKVTPRTKDLKLEKALVEISTAYLASTRYLLPFIFSFARASRAISALSSTPLEPHLVLRDGLIFWPSLSLLSGPKTAPSKFLLYTRSHTENAAPPKVFELDPHGHIREKNGKLPSNTLIVDVGLYGTLLSNLMDKGWCEERLSAFFFASRSPFVSGWVNLLLNHSILNHGRFDLVDIIRLADTVESLLKPFVVYPSSEIGHTSERFSDLISFVCSTALLWAIHEYSKEQIGNGKADAEILTGLDVAKENPSSWFIKEPVERWKKADEFLASWKHGPLFPMNYLCGFKV